MERIPLNPCRVSKAHPAVAIPTKQTAISLPDECPRGEQIWAVIALQGVCDRENQLTAIHHTPDAAGSAYPDQLILGSERAPVDGAERHGSGRPSRRTNRLRNGAARRRTGNEEPGNEDYVPQT